MTDTIILLQLVFLLIQLDIYRLLVNTQGFRLRQKHLATIGHQMDDEERSRMLEAGTTEEYNRFIQVTFKLQKMIFLFLNVILASRNHLQMWTTVATLVFKFSRLPSAFGALKLFHLTVQIPELLLLALNRRTIIDIWII